VWRRSFTLAVICLSACSAREPLGVATGTAGASGTSVEGSERGQVAGGGGASPTAELVTLAIGQLSPSQLAIDGNSVYWVNTGAEKADDTSVAKVPLAGGAVTVLVSGVAEPRGIVVDSSRVYFAAGPDEGLGSGPAGLMSVPLAGGAVSLVATGFDNDPIAIGPWGVYGSSLQNLLLEAPLAGGAAVALTPRDVLSGSDTTYGIAVDAHWVYWTQWMDPTTVLKAPIEGGAATTLTSAPGAGFGIAVDATSIYFATGQGIMKVALTGGPATTLSTSAGIGIAIDDAYLYFTYLGGGPGYVKKVAKSGGATTTLWTAQAEPWGIAVDATSVYWASGDLEGGANGTIMKLTPK
jgi:hypothetical protein